MKTEQIGIELTWPWKVALALPFVVVVALLAFAVVNAIWGVT